MPHVYRTGEVVELLDCLAHQPTYVVRAGWIPAPKRSSSNQYRWTDADVRRARNAVAWIRPYKRKAKA